MGRSLRNIVELDRVFLEVPNSVSGLDPEDTLQAALVFDRSERWEDLLKHHAVVVLGEAGTGKTTEFKLRARALAEEGRFAVFVDISDLAANGLTLSIDVGDKSRLRQWRDDDKDGVFFLDSLDEAKLRGHTLGQAMRRLHHELEDEWSRTRLVVSCRASDWMPEADRDEFRRLETPDESPDVHIVQLAPLDTRQAGKLARLARVTNVDAFMAAVADACAQIFLERPLDVQWMGAYWVRNERVGSLRELIADNVREKLRERPGRSSALAPTKLEEGLRVLAGMAMIEDAWAFSIPDEPLDARRTVGAVDPQQFLPDWSPNDIGELLRRPIFDEATYGRVRLHHRSVQEYLAAQWLDELISNGLPDGKVFEIFFWQEGGERVIPDHLGPVAAWLAQSYERLRLQLIKEAPWVLIEHGDPSGFSSEIRRQIFRSYVNQYQERDRRFDRFDYVSLKRFSSPELSDEIEALLTAPETSHELMLFLLRLVESGHLTNCANTCLTLALDDSRSGEVKVSSILAIDSAGTDTHRAALMGLLSTTKAWEQDVAGAFVRALYPDPLDVPGLMQLLGRVKPKPAYRTSTVLELVLEHDVPRLGTASVRLELLQSLIRAVRVPDTVQFTCTVPPDREWLLPTLAGLVCGVERIPEGR